MHANGRLKVKLYFQTAFLSAIVGFYMLLKSGGNPLSVCRYLHLPLQAEHGIARFAVEAAAVGGTAVLVFVVAFVGQVVDRQPQLQVFARAVLDVGVPNGVAALLE